MGKKIAFLGWAFKKDTNDTRESAAIYVAKELLEDQVEVHVYDPKVSEAQIKGDISYLMKQEQASTEAIENTLNRIHVYSDPYAAMKNAHVIAVLTEWDEFKTYNWQQVYDNMLKPAFLFDGRNILNVAALQEMGFVVKGIGKA